MKKWQDLAAPDDPNSWYDVNGMWPTHRGTYERILYTSGTELTATGVGTVRYAFAARTTTGTREYVVESAQIWEYATGAYTDRTGGVSIGTYPMMAQYGDITICVMGNSVATVKSSGGNFSTLAGAPKGEIVLVQSNAVLIFNTDTAADGWAASDVGDYTNWTTGEAATGRLIQTPGPITAAVAFGDSVIVFKQNSVYRMRYVGGVVKWTAEVLHHSVGCSAAGYESQTFEKYSACASHSGVLFTSAGDPYNKTSQRAYYFDGVSQFIHVNPLTTLTYANTFRIRYTPNVDIFTLSNASGSNVYFYCPSANAWGKSNVTNADSVGPVPVLGEAIPNSDMNTPTPLGHYKSQSNKLKRYAPVAAQNFDCYIESARYGSPLVKTKFTRLTPLLQRRVNTVSGTHTVSLSVYFWPERHTAHSSPSSTQANIAESGFRNRFDFQGADTYASFLLTFSNMDVEIDDIAVASMQSGRD
jgi:hypothetical protein